MFVADLHNDVLQRAIIGEDISKRSSDGHSDIIRLLESKINLEVFVIWITKQYLELNPFKRANDLINKLEEIEKNSKSIKIVRSTDDLNFVRKNSYLAAPFSIEGGECLESNLDNLYHFIKRGILYLGPTWNYSNTLASSAYDETYNKDELNNLGLTNFGEEVIKLCQEFDVLIDVSHIGEKSFWDIIKLSKAPIIASHSCVYNICEHYRNLKDDQIIAIKNTEGGIFVNLYPNFLDSNFSINEEKYISRFKNELDIISDEHKNEDKKWIYKQNFLQKKLQSIAPDLSIFIDHIEYIIKLIGIDYVGVGSDYDGIDCLPKQLLDCTGHMLIVKELEKRKYSTKDIEKIMGLNFLRIYNMIKAK